ncbi:MAG TPA: hypothetical protein PKX00_25455 [Opitutaceae bacterium]|nr:hypothetical protein [Opitutaceae bacterium]
MHDDEDETALAGEDDRETEPFYRLDADGRLTWTEEGLRAYRRRFARFGIRIEAIETFEDYRTALTLSAAGFREQLMATAANGPPSLERNLLVAFARGDDTEYRRLLCLAERRNALGLRVAD